MIAFALFELRIPSYEYLMDMSWSEFQLRRYAFQLSEKRQWYHTREIGYAALIGGGVDPKKLSKEKYMPLDTPEKPKVSSKALEALAEARKTYNETVNGSRV